MTRDASKPTSEPYSEEPLRLHAEVVPRTRRVLRMHPYLPIPKNEDGSGGGIRLRVYGEGHQPYYLDVFWGETTEIELNGL